MGLLSPARVWAEVVFLSIPCIPQNYRTGFNTVRTYDRKTYTSLAILLTVIQLLYALKVVRPSCEQVASSRAGIKSHQSPRLRLSNRWSKTASGCQNILDSFSGRRVRPQKLSVLWTSNNCRSYQLLQPAIVWINDLPFVRRL